MKSEKLINSIFEKLKRERINYLGIDVINSIKPFEIIYEDKSYIIVEIEDRNQIKLFGGGRCTWPQCREQYVWDDINRDTDTLIEKRNYVAFSKHFDNSNHDWFKCQLPMN